MIEIFKTYAKPILFQLDPVLRAEIEMPGRGRRSWNALTDHNLDIVKLGNIAR